MTTREKNLVRDSFLVLREDAGGLALLFYGKLFALEPKIRPMFRGDIERQGMKLMSMLTAVVESLDRFESLIPVLHAMGQRHTAYGVLPRHYEVVEQALAWAFGQALEVDSGTEVLWAWRKLVREVSDVMQVGAEELTQARARG